MNIFATFKIRDFSKGLQLNQIHIPLSFNCHSNSVSSFQSPDPQSSLLSLLISFCQSCCDSCFFRQLFVCLDDHHHLLNLMSPINHQMYCQSGMHVSTKDSNIVPSFPIKWLNYTRCR